MESSAGIEALPEDIVRVVLSHLPSPWVVQARVVCKQWRRILSSTQFALQWAAIAHSSSPLHSLCLLLPNDSASFLHALHFPTLLCIPLPLPCIPASCTLLASSPLGLLLSSSSSSSSSLSLFHPISRLSLHFRPPRLIHTPLAAALAPFPLPSSTHFHILAVGVPDNPPSHTPAIVAELYCSASSSWTPLPCLPALRNTTRIPRSSLSLIWWKEAFCMLWGNRILTFKPSCTMQAAIRRGAEESTIWGSIELPVEPRVWDARFLTLHVIEDCLFVEGNFQEQGDFQRRYPLRIGVVKFDAEKRLWKEASFMPEALSKRLCKQQHPAHCFYTTYSDPLSDHIYFTPFIDQAYSKGTQMDIDIVVFDVNSSSWSSVSKVPASAALFSSPLFKGLTFHASNN